MFKKLFLTFSLFFTTWATMNARVIEITSANFDQQVKQNNKPVILDTYATWCQPCNNMKPIFEELSELFENKIIFAKLDIDTAPQIASSLNVEMIPTFFIFHKGSLVQKIVGSKSKEKLTEIIKNFLKTL